MYFTYSAKHDDTANYRVEVLNVSAPSMALALRNEVAGDTECVFKRYGGQPVDILIELYGKLIGVLYDKFGQDTKMMRTHKRRCVATVKLIE